MRPHNRRGIQVEDGAAMSVYIHPRGPKYFENYDKIAWDRQELKQEEMDDNRHCPDSLQELRSDD